MAIHSKNWWAARLATETEYASGSGASAYGQTKLSALTSMPYPKSYGDNMLPMQKIAREKLASHDDGEMGGDIINVGWEGIESSREEYVQDSFLLDKILTLSQGSLPESYALHWQDHIRAGSAADNLRYECFGVYLKELGFSIPENKGSLDSFPYWKISENCYSTKYDKGAGTTIDSLVKVPWLALAGAPISTLASFTINGQVVNAKSGELTITPKYDDVKEAGDYGLKYPYFLGYDNIKFTCSFNNYTQWKSFIENVLLETESYYPIKINTGLASFFIQITNMRVINADLNRIPASGLAEYSLEFEKTDQSVLSKESS